MTWRTVEAVIPDGDSRFYLRDPPREVDDLLHDELAYFIEGAEFMPRYQNTNWDGYKRLYRRRDHSAPAGLLDRMRTLLAENGYDLTVTDEGDRAGDPISVGWHFEHDLRDYQQRAVRQTLDADGGVISIPTGGGKTAVGLRLVRVVGQRALVLVHTKELLNQWAGRVRDVLEVEPGRIGDGEWSEGPVTVAMMQTLNSRGTDDLADYGVLLFDECHRTSAADTMHTVGMEIDAAWRIGLSATPWRSVDGAELKIEGAVGGVAAEVSAEKLIDAGHLARPEFLFIDPAEYGEVPTARDGEEYEDVYRRCIVRHGGRNRAIADTAADLAGDGYMVLISVDRITHGQLLRYALSGVGLEDAVAACGNRLDDPRDERAFKRAARTADVGDHGAVFLSGEDDTDRREAILGRFKDGEVPILVSTLLKEGVDLPRLDAIVLAEGEKSEIAKIQTVGRALRPAGGDHAVIADVRDRGKHLGEHFEARMEAFADYYGKYGPEPPQDAGVGLTREWLDRNGFDRDAVAAYRDGDRVRIEPSSIEDFDRFVGLMRDTPAVSYDGEANYVEDPFRLPGPGGV